MTAFLEVKIDDPDVAVALRKAIRGLVKGTLTIDNCELVEAGILLSYHRTPRKDTAMGEV